MPVERCDYYSEEEYQEALQMEQAEMEHYDQMMKIEREDELCDPDPSGMD